MKQRNDSVKPISAGEFSKLNAEEKIMLMAEGLQVPQGKDENLVLESIFAQTEKKARPVFRMQKYRMQAAATVILLVGIFSLVVYLSPEKLETGFASQSTVTLPDGSAVNLNAGSELVWNKRNFLEKRQVKLTGEAFFSIEKGNRFEIATENGKVVILGTELNVFSRDKEFSVSCISGKVGVSAGNDEVILLPGEKAELNESGLTKSVCENIGQTAAWKDGLFYFDDQPLVSIFAEIERQFDVKVTYPGDKNRKITASFKSGKLTEALDVVCIPMGLKYEVDKNNTIRISENN